MPLTFAQLQAEVAEWAGRNFPANTDNEPFHGLVEEVGELAAARIRSITYRRDGSLVSLRMSAEDEKDAIGDVIIYLCDYCTRRGLAVAEILDGHALFSGSIEIADYQREVEMSAEWETAGALQTSVHVGRLAHARLKAKQGIRGTAEQHARDERSAVAGILRSLSEYASLRCFDLAEIVEKTWDQVKKRDWKANPTTGATVPAEPDVFPMTFYPTLPGRNPYEN